MIGCLSLYRAIWSIGLSGRAIVFDYRVSFDNLDGSLVMTVVDARPRLCIYWNLFTDVVFILDSIEEVIMVDDSCVGLLNFEFIMEVYLVESMDCWADGCLYMVVGLEDLNW